MIKGEALEDDEEEIEDDFSPDQFNNIQGWLLNKLRGRFRSIKS